MSDELIGLWRLVSAKREYEDGEVSEIYGGKPRGYLLLAPGGRMMAILTATDRSSTDNEAGLYREMMAYSGRYRVEGNRWITDVDVSWHPDWLGTGQMREFRLDGDELHIRTQGQPHPANPGRIGRGILLWRREDSLSGA